MRVVHVSYSDTMGGASRAAFRINQALNRSASIESKMLVRARFGSDESVVGFAPGRSLDSYIKRFLRGRQKARQEKYWADFSTPNNSYLSRADISTDLLSAYVARHSDIIHLHWLGKETLSIEEIGQINKPVVWTLHDMWPFCGAEHTVPDLPDARFRTGYAAENRTEGETGPDMNRAVWERKRSAWTRPMTIVCPSRWLTKCARESVLFQNWRVSCIPQPLDMEQWRPMDQNQARRLLDLPADRRIILFGAVGGEADLNKGADLLRNALHHLSTQGRSDFHLVIFGQSAPSPPVSTKYPQTYLGRIQDDAKLVAAYSAADVMLVPSRQENLPNTAVEAHACGTPVVAFNTSGLPDIVEHKTTGYLARPFDTVDLAAGIAWVLECPERRKSLGVAARNSVLQKFSEEIVAASYSSLYGQILAGTSF